MSRINGREIRRKDPSHSHGYLVPAVLDAVRAAGEVSSLLDLGCGSGEISDRVRRLGLSVSGTEFDLDRLEKAKSDFPDVDFFQHDIDDALPAERCNRYDVVTAVEVVEHLLLPRNLFARAAEALKPEGALVITTPYHGWLKNVLIAVSGKSDSHYMPWVDYGHVKFFSPETLGDMAIECGFRGLNWEYVGRVRPLAKSMVLVARPSPA